MNDGTSNLTFSGSAFGLGRCGAGRTMYRSEDLTWQLARPVEDHAGDDPGLEPTVSNTAVRTGHRPEAQPPPQRLDWILRTLCSFSAVPLMRYVNQTLVAWAVRKFK